MFPKTPNCEWLHCYGVEFLSPMGLRYDDFISDQTPPLIVSLGKGSERLSLNRNLDPDIICTGRS